MENLFSLRPSSWREVFELWESSESKLNRWIKHYHQRGYASWAEWRTHTLNDLKPGSLVWNLYMIENHERTIPAFYSGPFRSWEKYYNGSSIAQFSTVAQQKEVQESPLIKEMIEHFPNETMLIGILWKNKVVVIDGLHRCCAVAIAATNNIKMPTKISIALAEFSQEELPLLGGEKSPAA